MDKEIYYSRLALFADYLDGEEETDKIISTLTMSDSPRTESSTITVDVLFNVFNHIPYVFDNWYFECINNEPIVEGDEFGSTIDSVYNFFGIVTVSEFSQLFGLRKQSKEYSNIILTEDSTLKEIAQNIVNYVKTKRRLEK